MRSRPKILLINPPNSLPRNSDFVVNVFQPLGLAYVAAALRQKNYQVSILDALALGFSKPYYRGSRKIIGLTYSQIQEYIEDFQPDFIGIATPFSFQAQEAHYLAKFIKRLNSRIIIIAGGAHATIQPEEIMNDTNFDYVVRGEGEVTTPQLIYALTHHQSLTNIANISYRLKTNKVVHNPRNLPIQNLDTLPLPARDLLPLETYHRAAKAGRVIESMLAFGQRRTSLFTSRGCPFTCTFCSVHLTMTRIWRPRSPENVLKEIIECVNKYQINYFDILDDNFTFDPERAKEICRLIIKHSLNIRWSTPNGIRADRVDDELIRLMKQAGCIQVKVAPESGSQRVLTQVIKKNLDLNKVKETVALCKTHRLSVEAFFVIGFPEETIEDIRTTIQFAQELRRLGCDYCYFFIATPYFGTEMYESAVKHKYLNPHTYNLTQINTTSHQTLLKSPNYAKPQFFRLYHEACQINPPVTKIRLIAAFKIIFVDPQRILRFALAYLKNFFL